MSADPEADAVALAVLAAGGSRRMRGEHKLLRPFPDVSVVRRATEAALASGLGQVAIVVPAASHPVAQEVEDLPVALLENARAASGLSTSVRVALGWAAARATALVLLLGDEPGVDPAVIRSLVAHWRRDPVPALRARYRDRPGHPVLVRLDAPADLPFDLPGAASGGPAGPHGDTGLRRVLPPEAWRDFPVPADAPVDIDTEADYRAALARLPQ